MRRRRFRAVPYVFPRSLVGVCGVVLLSSLQVFASASIKWKQPSEGDVFAPGDTIEATWSGKKIISPSFRLCVLAEEEPECGKTVWPDVTKNEKQRSFSIALSVPELPSQGKFYLEMKNDLGDTHESPVFQLTPSKEEPEAVPSPSPSTSMTSTQIDTQSSTSATESPLSSFSPSSTAPSIATIRSAALPVDRPSRPGPSIVAAVLVPLIFVALTLLAAWLARRAKRKSPPPTSTQPTRKEGEDLEKAVSMLTAAPAPQKRRGTTFKDVVRRMTTRRRPVPSPIQAPEPRRWEPTYEKPTEDNAWDDTQEHPLTEIPLTPRPPAATTRSPAPCPRGSPLPLSSPNPATLSVLASYLAPSPYITSSGSFPSSPYLAITSPSPPPVGSEKLPPLGLTVPAPASSSASLMPPQVLDGRPPGLASLPPLKQRVALSDSPA